jgi:hypothetical protein
VSIITQVILVVHGVLGFLAGYLTQQLSVTIYTIGVGFALSCLAVLPPWPMYRKNPLNVCLFLMQFLRNLLCQDFSSGNPMLSESWKRRSHPSSRNSLATRTRRKLVE